MLLHNLNIALRNLGKYKLQTTISVLSIAIGIVVLAVVHSMLYTHLRPAEITNMPYYDRVCTVFHTPVQDEGRNTVSVPSWTPAELRALKSGGLQSIEMGPVYTCFDHYVFTNIPITLNDTLVRRTRLSPHLADAAYAHYAGYRSALTGKRIAPLKPGEIILPELIAKEAFGDLNPVGAHLLLTSNAGTRTHLVVADVYKAVSQTENIDVNAAIYALDDAALDQAHDEGEFQTTGAYMVLKPGYTPEQLEEEMNRALQPFGKKARVELAKDRTPKEVERVWMLLRMFAYLLGSLILVAAIIGFLRMQTQLFWMRKRELSLRIVNGAKRRQLFMLLMTEVSVVLLCTLGVALLFGYYLEQLAYACYRNLMDGRILLFGNLVPYSLFIAGVLLLLCSLVVWISLSRIYRNVCGLAANMRGSRSHVFRNVMLWLQVTVGMFFVCTAFVIAYLFHLQTQQMVYPDDDRPYKESILVEFDYASNGARLLEELRALPDVKRTIPFNQSIVTFDEYLSRDSLWQSRGRDAYLQSLCIVDTALMDYYKIRATWLRPELKGEQCVLIHEELYPIWEREGVLANGILTLYNGEGGIPLPIAGTFKDVVFSKKNEEARHNFIYFLPNMVGTRRYILEAEPGRYDALWNEVEATIARVEPTVANQVAFNFYDRVAKEMFVFTTVRKALWLLGGVALIVCLMGIYSTIALDTRARRKEVAIRKINGAKSGDIARLFARLYVVLIALALTVILSLAAIIHYYLPDDVGLADIPILLLALAGCLVVILSIALIVGWQVRSIMRINPAEMVAKE